MSAPIGHTFFAHRAFHQRFPGQNLRAFVVATHLPDVRNVSGHPRAHTHDQDMQFERVLAAEDIFEMGYRLHSFVDALHWRVFADAGVADTYYANRSTSTAWKFVEDEILYSRLHDIATVVAFFDDILEDELRYGIAEEHIRQWHGHVQRYLRHAPTPEKTPQRLAALGVTPDRVDEISTHAERFRNDKALPTYIDEVISRFDAALIL